MPDSSPTSNDWIPVLKALADETRLRTIRLLLRGPLRVGQIAEELGITTYNASKHLRILREADLVVMEPSGRTKTCTLAPAFRQTLTDNENVLDLGCCSFRFDELPG